MQEFSEAWVRMEAIKSPVETKIWHAVAMLVVGLFKPLERKFERPDVPLFGFRDEQL
jgi:hypothetical protein